MPEYLSHSKLSWLRGGPSWLSGGLLLLLVAALIVCALSIRSRASKSPPTVESTLAPEDLVVEQILRKDFGLDSGGLLIGLGGEWSETRLATLVRDLRGVEGVDRVLSTLDALGDFEIPRHWVDVPALDEFLHPHRDFRVLLLSGDVVSESVEQSQRLMGSLREVLSKHLGHDRAALFGAAQMRADTWELTQRELSSTVIFLVAIIVLIPWLIFGAWSACVYPLTVTAATVLPTLAAYVWIHGPLDVLSLALIPVLFAISTLDALHLLQTRREARDRPLMRKAWRDIGPPCFWTTLTTVIGFCFLAIPDSSP